ncbi:hypothetical protein F1559_000579 [Cyanidiococcus yangmingshanensis]|uniref:Uncharacterized protein n=1 Tax=Cyanidiococcus yangmingshanensis TaxID=2690220 RepID=A0A7J7IRD5_9RHOD|nr:hypothetical protein F1559_000579 [Cyanidiococcus yangmingshanensis]
MDSVSIGIRGPNGTLTTNGAFWRATKGLGNLSRSDHRSEFVSRREHLLSMSALSRHQGNELTGGLQPGAIAFPCRPGHGPYLGCRGKPPVPIATIAMESGMMSCPGSSHPTTWRHAPLVVGDRLREESISPKRSMESAVVALLQENRVLRERIQYLESRPCRCTILDVACEGVAPQDPEPKSLAVSSSESATFHAQGLGAVPKTAMAQPDEPSRPSFVGKEMDDLPSACVPGEAPALSSMDAGRVHRSGMQWTPPGHKADGGFELGYLTPTRDAQVSDSTGANVPMEPKIERFGGNPRNSFDAQAQWLYQQACSEEDRSMAAPGGLIAGRTRFGSDPHCCARCAPDASTGSAFLNARPPDAKAIHSLPNTPPRDASQTPVHGEQSSRASRSDTTRRRYSIWSDEEERIFYDAYARYGCKWNRIKVFLPRKTRQQVQSHGAYLIKRGVIKKFNSRRWTRHERAEAA